MARATELLTHTLGANVDEVKACLLCPGDQAEAFQKLGGFCEGDAGAMKGYMGIHRDTATWGCVGFGVYNNTNTALQSIDNTYMEP